MGANTKDGAQLTGLIFARRRRRQSNDLIIKSSPNSASQAVFQDWLFDAAAGGAYTLTANHGTYATTGQSATLLRSKLVTANNGTYSLTGQSASVYQNKLVTAANGSYSLTGQAATITYAPGANDYLITAQAGSYSTTGQAATITRSKLIAAGAGAYSATGQDATLLVDRLLSAGSGSYGLTGQAAEIGYVGGSPGGYYPFLRKPRNTRKILVTVNGARFLVPEDIAEAWVAQHQIQVEEEPKPAKKAKKRRSLVIVNTTDKAVQSLVASINENIVSEFDFEQDDEEILMMI